jgi:hypothetical protein
MALSQSSFKAKATILLSKIVHTIRNATKGTSVFVYVEWKPELFSFASSFFLKKLPRDCIPILLGYLLWYILIYIGRKLWKTASCQLSKYKLYSYWLLQWEVGTNKSIL